MNDQEYLKEAIQFIARDFHFKMSTEDDAADNTALFEEMRTKLLNEINYLLRANFEKLMFLLHRIDVDEFKVKEAFRIPDIEKVGTELTELVIERHLQKAKTRYESRILNGPEANLWQLS